eukprot:3278068-Amphidinium_carterae.3
MPGPSSISSSLPSYPIHYGLDCSQYRPWLLAQPMHTTWKHPSGSEQQIDFLWVPRNMVSRGLLQTCHVGPWAYFDCGTTSDHRHVEAVVIVEGQQIRKRKQHPSSSRAKIADAAHLDRYTQDMRSSLPDWNGETSPFAYLKEAMCTAEQVIKRTAPKRAPPRKPWLTAEVWSQMADLNLWRRYLTAIRRSNHMLMLHYYQRLGSPDIPFFCCGQCSPNECKCAYLILAEAAVSAKVKQLRSDLRRALRVCRKSWFSDICTMIDKHGSSNESRLLHKAVKQICSRQSCKGSRLRDDAGAVLNERSLVSQKWLKYWQAHYGASIVDAGSFTDRDTRTARIADGNDVSADHFETLCFSLEEVSHVLKTAHKWKATADPVPAAALTAVASKLAPALMEMFNTCMRERTVPIAYAGARIAPIYKKKGSELDCTSYRPVALLTLEAKLLAKLCLDKLTPRLAYHCSQYGSGVRPGVLYPQVSIHQAAAFARMEGLASATIFVDVIGAFDSVPLPLMWSSCSGTDEVENAQQFERLGYAQPTAQSMAEFLQRNPCILEQVGVPHAVIAVLRNWGSSTWLITDTEQQQAVHPHTGVLQGQNLAGLLFDLFYSELMKRVNTKLEALDIGIKLSSPRHRTLVLDEEAETCHIHGVAYRDDYALPLVAPSNAELIHLLGKTMSILAGVHNEFHLEINYSRGKTECTVNMSQPDSKAYFQGLRLLGKAAGLSGPAVAMPAGQHLLVAADYCHLGRAEHTHRTVA